MDFINSNYSDPELSLTLIADRFNKGATYISSFFKEQMGTCLIDYINNVRIGAAKKLLTDTSESITGIGEKIGYINTNNFIKNFKKYEGTTPGHYREKSMEIYAVKRPHTLTGA